MIESFEVTSRWLGGNVGIYHARSIEKNTILRRHVVPKDPIRFYLDLRVRSFLFWDDLLEKQFLFG
jgi:hypothetical protein